MTEATWYVCPTCKTASSKPLLKTGECRKCHMKRIGEPTRFDRERGRAARAVPVKERTNA